MSPERSRDVMKNAGLIKIRFRRRSLKPLIFVTMDKVLVDDDDEEEDLFIIGYYRRRKIRRKIIFDLEDIDDCGVIMRDAPLFRKRWDMDYLIGLSNNEESFLTEYRMEF